MDIGFLLRLLTRRKWLILAVMGIASAAVFAVIERRPERYKASVIVATGIVNYKGIKSDGNDAFVQQFQIENAFSNLTEFARSRSTLKLVTIDMLRRDLLAEGAGDTLTPFRQANSNLATVTADDRRLLLEDLVLINLDSITDPSFNQNFDYRLDKVARAYGYDNDALLRALAVKRKGETDNLVIDMVTENPALSAYLANVYVQRLMVYYQNLSVKEKKQKVDFYKTLAAQMRLKVDSIKAVRYDYLEQRGLPALGKQSEELVKQLNEMEIARQEALSRKEAARESYDRIQRYIDDKSSRDANETRARVLDKTQTAELSDRVRQLREQSAKSGGKDPEVESQLSEAQEALKNSLKTSARTVGKPKQQDESKRTREDLYKDRVSLDLERISAEKTITQLNSKIGSLQGQLHTYVANDEYATTLEAEQQRAEDEFSKVNEQLIQAKLELEKAESPLSVLENAQTPEYPEPNRQILLTAFAGIATGSMTAIAVLLLAYFDNRLQSPELFRRFSGNMPLLGAIPMVPVRGLDFDAMFAPGLPAGRNAKQVETFREQVRKLRGSLLRGDNRVFLFVSPKASEGKTFIQHALAYSMAANQRSVLMIDTNFKNPLPEAYTSLPSNNSAILNRLLRDHHMVEVFQLKNSGVSNSQQVDVIGNHSQGASPSELLNDTDFREFLKAAGEHYDYIFLEAASLNQYSDAHELEHYADRIIAIFNAGNTLRPADQEAMRYMRGLGEKFAGAVLTGVDERTV